MGHKSESTTGIMNMGDVEKSRQNGNGMIKGKIF
jgi:hypothetical protein